MNFIVMLANVLEDDHSAALFISFIESPFLLQCAVDSDLVECDPNTITSRPTFFNAVTHRPVDVVMRLWGLTKLIKRFWFFRRSLVF